MNDPILARLADLGLVPSPATEPPPWFEPVARDGAIAYVSGQVAFGSDGALIATGLLGQGISTQLGQDCARQCAANALRALSDGLNGLQALDRIIKLTVFVASTADFTEQPVVANGASETLHAVLGSQGRHARSAIGVAALPLGSPVEIELIASVR
jgi:enamine deaminase RidA (YjgF/YER057c/UK114 family)